MSDNNGDSFGASWLTLYGLHYEIVPSKFQFLNLSVSWNKYKVKMSKVFVFDGFVPIFQFVAFMQHCLTEGVKWSIFQRSSYFEFAYIYSKNSIEGNYLFKINDITKRRSAICSKFTIETPKYCFCPLIVNFSHTSFLWFYLLNWNR